MAQSPPPGSGCVPAPGATLSSLPHELKFLILEFLCADPADNPIPIPTPFNSTTNATILPPIQAFASVCRKWREIAHASQELWKYYRVSLPYEVDVLMLGNTYARLREDLARYLLHAPSLICFHITGGGGGGPWKHRVNILALCDLLLDYAPTSESLTLYISSDTLQIFRGAAPFELKLPFLHLEEVRIILPGTMEQEEMGWMRSVDGLRETFAGAPNLRLFSLSVEDSLRAASAPRLLFVDTLPLRETVTTLIITCIWISANDSKQFWILCPQLESCTFWLAPFLHEVVHSGLLHLTRLRLLNITYRAFSPEPFDSLIAPRLVILVLSMEVCEDPAEDFPHEALLAFRARSNYELEELHLDFNFSEQPHGVRAILEDTPSLERLTLRWTQYSDPGSDQFEVDVGMNNLLVGMARINHDTDTMEMLPALCSIDIDLVSPYVPAVWDVLYSRVDRLSEVRLNVLVRETRNPRFEEECRRHTWELSSRNGRLNIVFLPIDSFDFPDDDEPPGPDFGSDESSDSDTDGSEAGSVSTEATTVAEEDELPSHSGSSEDIFADETPAE